jgi:hypothetical protein
MDKTVIGVVSMIVLYGIFLMFCVCAKTIRPDLKERVYVNDINEDLELEFSRRIGHFGSYWDYNRGTATIEICLRLNIQTNNPISRSTS